MKPEINEMNYILNDILTDSGNTNIHSFEYRCVYGVKYLNVENNEEIILTVTVFFRYMKFKTHLSGINKKNQKCVENWIEIQ